MRGGRHWQHRERRKLVGRRDLGGDSSSNSSGGSTNATSGSGGETGGTTGASTTGGSSGSSGGTTGGVDAGIDAGFVEAAHPLLPQIPYNGGSILSDVAVVTITWEGDDISAQLEQFDDWVVTSADYFGLVLPQYGIDGGSILSSVSLAALDSGVLDDSQVAGILVTAIDAGILPEPSSQTLYVLYPPDGVTVTAGGQGCVDFQAYHSSTPTPLGTLVYAMIPRCSQAAQQSGLSELDFTTWAPATKSLKRPPIPGVQRAG